MLDLLYESPVIVAMVGTALTGLLVFFWIQSAKRAVLVAAMLCGLLSVGMVVMSVNVVTDRERILLILDEVADALEENNHEVVFGYIHPNAVAAVQRARSELPAYAFSEARVTRVRELSVNKGTVPPTAMVEFTVVVNVALQGMQYRGPRLIRIYMMQSDGRWLVRDYQHTAPTAAGFPEP